MNINNVIIKQVTINDFEKYKNQMLELHSENMRLHFPNKGIKTSDIYAKKDMEDICGYLEKSTAIVLLAIFEEEVIGFLWGYIRDFFDEKRIYINSFIVHSNYRSNNIGNLLLTSVNDIAQKQYLDAVYVSTAAFNNGGLNFYRNNGFVDERVYLVKSLNDGD